MYTHTHNIVILYKNKRMVDYHIITKIYYSVVVIQIDILSSLVIVS